MKNNIYRSNLLTPFLLLGLIILMNGNLFAHNINIVNSLGGAAIVPSASGPAFVVDDKYGLNPATNGFANKKVTGFVRLDINHKSGIFIQNSYHYKIELTVNYNDINQSASSKNIELEIKYDPSSGVIPYIDKSTFLLPDIHRINITVVSITDMVTLSSVSDPEDNMTIHYGLQIERYFDFNHATQICPSHSYINTDDEAELEITWDMLNGAEDYELEWTYVDDYGENLSTPIPANLIEWNFKNNSTRITTKELYYKVQLVFDRGYFIYRVRGVGRHKDDSEYYIFGAWNVDEEGVDPSEISTSCSTYYYINGHEENLNWQYNASFAEEGKKKELITYYDGTFRSRQLVTVISSDEQAVVQETIYDFYGREAVQTLPAPTGKKSFSYFPNFSRNLSDEKYTWLDFDTDASACTPEIEGMKNTGGSSRYYSSNNPVKNEYHAFLPDAFNYPFTQIEYTPDETGRIRRSSGVGLNHKLESGHETFYFYGKPMQEELDRLFGSEVGYAHHYKKNVIKDPNGQISISYLDLSGRVIATALSSTNPENVSALPSMPGVAEELEVDLFARDINGISLVNVPNIEGDRIDFNTHFLVSTEGDYEFDYSINAGPFLDECLPLICFKCIYDIEIVLRDECGEEIFSEIATIGTIDEEFGCSGVIYSFWEPVVRLLPIGNYQLSKSLVINREAFDFYLEAYLDTVNEWGCVTPLSVYLEEEYTVLSGEDCEFTCDDCTEELGTLDQFINNLKGTEEDWYYLYEKCIEPCQEISLCEQFRHLMLMDMSPGGQYAEWQDTINGNTDVFHYPLSIFNPLNKLSDGGLAYTNEDAAFWRRPKLENNIGFYNKDLKTRSKIKLTQTEGVYYPLSHSTFEENGVVYSYPENLRSIKDFVQFWQPSWAYSLVRHHPEYCYYEWCLSNVKEKVGEQIISSEEFDRAFMNVETYSEAVINGYISDTDEDALVDKDPFFTHYNTDLKDMMKQLLASYDETGFSVKEVASIGINCPGYHGVIFPGSCIGFGEGTTEENNLMWNKYKSLYNSIKQVLIKRQADKAILEGECNTGVNLCIGVDHYNPPAYKLFRLDSYAYSLFESDGKVCSHDRWKYYITKERRFNLGETSPIDIDEELAAYSMIEMTGKCQFDVQLSELIINTVSDENHLTDHSLINSQYFSKQLYSEIIKGISGIGDGDFEHEMEWIVEHSVDSLHVLRIFFRDINNTSDITTCPITLYLPVGYDWADVTKLFDFEYMADMAMTPANGFAQFKAELSTTTNILNVVLRSCFKFDDCVFASRCIMTDYSKSLISLLSALTYNDELQSASIVVLESNYELLLTPNLFPDNYGDAGWRYNGSGEFELILSNAPNEFIYFDSYDDKYIDNQPFTHADLNKIVYFEVITIEPEPTHSNSFRILAWIDDGADVLKPLWIHAHKTYGRLDFLNCVSPSLSLCDRPEYTVKDDIRNVLNLVIQNKNESDYDITHGFSDVLHSYFGSFSDKVIVKNLLISSDRLSLDLEIQDISTSDVLNICKIELYRSDPYYDGVNDLENDLISLSELIPDLSEGEGGATSYFKITANFNDDYSEQLGGFISCIKMKSCGNCDGGGGDGTGIPPAIDYLLCEDGDAYERKLTETIRRFNSNYFGNNPFGLKLVLSYIPQECECMLEYSYYLETYNDTLEPMSLYEFLALSCKYSDACDEYLEYALLVNSYNSLNPNAPLEIEDISGIDCECLAMYIKYLRLVISSITNPHPTGYNFYNLSNPMTLSEYVNLPTTGGCKLPDFRTAQEGGPPFNKELIEDPEGCNDCCDTTYRNGLRDKLVKSLLLEYYDVGSYTFTHTEMQANCECLLNYYTYIKSRYLREQPVFNPLTNEVEVGYGDAPPNPPMSLEEFMNAGCPQKPDCWLEYLHFKNKFKTDPGMNSEIECSCYLSYVNKYGSNPNLPNIPSVEDFCEEEEEVSMLGGFGSFGLMSELEEGELYYPFHREIKMTRNNHQTYGTKFKYRPCSPPVNVIQVPAFEFTDPCESNKIQLAYTRAYIKYMASVQEATLRFRTTYYGHCFTFSTPETFTVKMPLMDYHYTLYYYDQAGNLVRTVPPEGVRPITSPTQLEKVNEDRTNNTRTVFTTHNLQTVYEYNSLNQLTRQSVPDHDKMDIWYLEDAAGIPSGMNVADVYYSDANNGFLVGNIGSDAYIYKTSDGGYNWNRVTDIRLHDMLKVQMIDTDKGFAVGNHGLFLKTIDGGQNWKIMPVWTEGVTANLTSLYFKDEDNGIVIGESGFCRKTDDGGETWSTVTGLGSENLLSISFKDASAGYISADSSGYAKVYSTGNWGSNWTTTNIHKKTRAGEVRRVYMINSNDGFAAGTEGTLMRTSDGGENWWQIACGMTLNINNLYFKDTDKGIVLDANGKFWQTTNGGLDWIALSAAGVYNSFHIYNKTDGLGVAVGNAGIVAKIDFTESYWFERMSFFQVPDINLSSVWVISSSEVFLAGEAEGDGKVYKTDLTATLPQTELVASLTDDPVVDIYFNSTALGAAITAGGKLIRMSHSGSWGTSDETGSGHEYVDLKTDGTTLYVLENSSQPATLFSTPANSIGTPGSGSTPASVAGDGDVNYLSVFASDKIFVSGENGTLYKWVSSWSNVSTHTHPLRLNEVKALAGTDVLYAVGENGTLIKSENNAAEWITVPAQTSLSLRAVDMFEEGEGIVAGVNGTLIVLTGDEAVISNHGLSVEQLNGVYAAASAVYYVAGNNGVILKTSDAGNAWQKEQAGGFSGNLYAVHGIGTGKVLIGGHAGEIRMKQSGSWNKTVGLPQGLRNVHLNGAAGLTAGDVGVNLHTSNGGNTWVLNLPLTTGSVYPNIHSVWANKADEVYAVGTDSYARKGVLNMVGASQMSFNTTASSEWRDISVSRDGMAVMAGDDKVWRRKPGETIWYSVYTASEQLNGVEIKNEYVFACGDNKALFKTEDIYQTSPSFGGMTAPGTLGAVDFKRIVFYDMARGYVVGTNGVLIKTVNFGSGWMEKDMDAATEDLNSMFVIGRNHLAVVGEDGYVKLIEDEADFVTSRFWYDKLGRLSVSQNTKQFNCTTPAYSYTLFDELGRISEVGEITNNTLPEELIINRKLDDALFSSWIVAGGRIQVSQTYYDAQFAESGVLIQQNLRKRVASVTYEEVYDGNSGTFNHATHYSYDIHGNVDHLVHEIPELAGINQNIKHITYDYDLVSGNVNRFHYNSGAADQYHHWYRYDSDNRIIEVYTSRDSVHWDNDASYFYYDHGPLARMELGEERVQGLDYVYTLHGWLKGVNGNTLEPDRDVGHDGTSTSSVARDVFGFSLGYYVGDYEHIGGVASGDYFLADVTGSKLLDARKDLWNGNIGWMVTTIPDVASYSTGRTIAPSVRGGAYKYDQLNRLAEARSFFNIDLGDNEWESSGSAAPAPFAESFTYDGMGNILTLKRNGSATEADMDDMTYRYDWIDKSDPGKGLHSNRLYHVNDAVSSGNYADDIDDMGAFDTAHATINVNNNYGYDELGNLVRDDAEEIAKIVWNAYGKIRKVIRTEESEKPDLEFLYDAGGHRLAKIVKPKPVEDEEQPHLVTWYVRDAQGNVVAVYGNKHVEKLIEQNVPCEDVVNFLVSQHSAETFADFAVDELEAHTWAGSEMELITGLELANQSMNVLYELDPRIILGLTSNVLNAVISDMSDADFVSMIVSDKGLVGFGNDLCSNGISTFLEHLYASDRNLFLQFLNNANPMYIINLWNYFNSPSPYPGYFMAAADLLGRADGDVVNAMMTSDPPGGCTYANVVVVGYVGFSPWMLENIYAAYSGLKSQATAMYLLPYFSTLTYNYFGSTTLWSMIDATGEMTRAEMLEFYYGHNAQMFMRKALRAHPTGFCVLNAPIELNLLNNKADIVGYFDQQALDDLMEYLAGLYTAKVEIFAVEEFHLYGSSRLGVHKTKFTLVETDEEETIIFEAEVDMEYKQHYIGQKGFELSNHLGNVLVVVTDRPIPVEDTLVSGTVGYFEAEIISISDYYAFGSEMPGRSYNSTSYRYGFQSWEKDDEIKGSGNHLSFGDFGYDPRIGRRWRPDPLAHEYPDLSPYAFVANNPIYYVDLDGRKIIVADKAQQAVVMGYLKDQFGADIFKFNKRGELKLDKKAFKAAQGGFVQEQSDIAKGLTEVIKSDRVIEAIIYSDNNINFSRNPMVPVQTTDPVTGETRTEYKPMFEGGKGVVIPELNQEGITLYIDGDNRAFILINQKLSKNGTFKADGGGETTPCESCIFIHEALDHGLDYVRTGSVNEPAGDTKKDHVKFHNKSLKNKGSKERTGEDHE